MAASPEDSQVLRIAVERNLITQNELRSATDRLHQHHANGVQKPVAEVLVELGYLTRTQLGRLLSNSEESGSRPAQQIPGYQLRKKIGAGAMGVVYKAKQLSLDRTVAIKILPKRLSQNPEFVERFYREGKAAAALNHNNIVQAIDVGDGGGFHYFVMEYVEGDTVYDALAKNSTYNESDAIKIVRQVALALQHAHERGIIHRDVKPKNIMITHEGLAKLADMGLARATSDVEAAMAEAGRAYGTPYYISPEQIRGDVHIDARADIYSLGATFYHMVTGRVPFEGSTPSAVMHKHLKEPIKPPDHINLQLSAGCAAMIEVMMAKNAAERYPSCKELIEDLDRLSRGEPPAFAIKAYDQHMLEQLSEGEEQQRPPEPVRGRDGVPVATAVVLGAVAGISVLINIILIAMR